MKWLNIFWIYIVVISVFFAAGFGYILTRENIPVSDGVGNDLQVEKNIQSGSDQRVQDFSVSDNHMTAQVDDVPSQPLPDEGRYVDWKPGIFDKYRDKQKVLFFYANWCPGCGPEDEILRQRSDEIPQNAVVVKVHYDDSQMSDPEFELARTYQIAYEHTFVILDQSGVEAARWNGGGLEEIKERLL